MRAPAQQDTGSHGSQIVRLAGLGDEAQRRKLAEVHRQFFRNRAADITVYGEHACTQTL